MAVCISLCVCDVCVMAFAARCVCVVISVMCLMKASIAMNEVHVLMDRHTAYHIPCGRVVLVSICLSRTNACATTSVYIAFMRGTERIERREAEWFTTNESTNDTQGCETKRGQPSIIERHQVCGSDTARRRPAAVARRRPTRGASP